jgi:hypothetical protein
MQHRIHQMIRQTDRSFYDHSFFVELSHMSARYYTYYAGSYASEDTGCSRVEPDFVKWWPFVSFMMQVSRVYCDTTLSKIDRLKMYVYS